METLTCPKCHGSMRTYERSSVHVDQCTECRGIFLDRGELERLLDAEAAFNEQPAASTQPGAAPGPPPPPPPPPAGGGQQGYPQHQPGPPPPAPAPPPQPGGYGQPGYPQQGYPQPAPGGHGYAKPHYKKRKSFFEELFDEAGTLTCAATIMSFEASS